MAIVSLDIHASIVVIHAQNADAMASAKRGDRDSNGGGEVGMTGSGPYREYHNKDVRDACEYAYETGMNPFSLTEVRSAKSGASSGLPGRHAPAPRTVSAGDSRLGRRSLPRDGD